MLVNTSAHTINSAIGGGCKLSGGRTGRWVWSDVIRDWECTETTDPYQNSQGFSIRQNKLIGNTYDKLSFIKRRIIQLSRSINIDKNTGIMDCQVLKEGIQSQIDFWPKFSSSNIFSFNNV